MALAAGDFVQSRSPIPLGVGVKLVMGTYTGPESYASGGESITTTIARSAFGVSKIYFLSFTPAVKAADGTSVTLVFDHNISGSSLGKIRAQAGGVGAHTHDISIIGGQAAAATDTVFCPAATDLLGKQEAGNAAVLGADVATKGGVVATTAGTTGAELAATTDLSDHVAKFVLYGI